MSSEGLNETFAAFSLVFKVLLIIIVNRFSPHMGLRSHKNKQVFVQTDFPPDIKGF